MPNKKSPNSVRTRNSTAKFLTFAYQTGGDGVEVRVEEQNKMHYAVHGHSAAELIVKHADHIK